MINQSNYEIFIIDYLDGKLSQKQVDVLFLFLEQNPELKEELNLLKNAIILPEPKNIAGPDFSTLKKPTYKQIKPLYENLLIDKVEGNITQQDETELNKALNLYPELNKDLALFLNTKLEVNKAVVFPNKKTLKKSIPFYKNPILLYYSSGIAAAFILVSFLYFYTFNNKVNNNNIASNLPALNKPNHTIVKENNALAAANKINVENQNTKIKKNSALLINNNQSNVNILKASSVFIEPKELTNLKYNAQFKFNTPINNIALIKNKPSTSPSSNPEFYTVKELLVQKINNNPLVNKLALTDSTGSFNLAQINKAINNNGLLTYAPIKDENGHNHGFALTSKYFSIERINK